MAGAMYDAMISPSVKGSVPEVVMFSTGLLTPGAQSGPEASGVSGHHLPGRRIFLAFSATCDMKKLIGA